MVAGDLTARLGQPITVENRSGATTIVGAQVLLQSPPDGYTMMTATIATLVFNAGVFTRLPYDPLNDFRHAAGLGVLPHVVAVHAGLPVQTLAELVALARARPGTLNFASPGIASPAHFAIERFQRVTGTRVIHVPYRGGSQLTTDLVSGTADATITDLASLAGQIAAGQIRALAATQTTRIEGHERIPTAADAGFPDLQIYSWQGVIMPAAVPDAVVERFTGEVAAALRTEGIRRRLRELGVEP
ncbi:MAG TPA: tripartite tricarboxylate transporter substrate binding protein, partial [Roseomonas sp.]